MEQQVDNKEDKIKLYKSISKLKLELKSIDKNLEGYGYQYQDFNEILKEVKLTIKKHKIDIDFVQKVTYKIILDNLVRVIETTFFSPSTGYEMSFDFPILKEDLAITTKSLSNLTPPQILGCAITYFKRYSLVSFLSIESDIDNDASYEIQNPKESKQIVNNNNNNNKAFNSLLACIKKIQEKNSENVHLKGLIEATKNGNGKEILNYFYTHPEVRTLEFWENVLIDYLTSGNIEGSLDKFSEFMQQNKEKIDGKPSIMCTLLLKDEFFKTIFENKK